MEWNEKERAIIIDKRDNYRNFCRYREESSLEEYNIAKKETKIVIGETRSKGFEETYKKLDMTREEKMYRLAYMRHRKSNDPCVCR